MRKTNKLLCLALSFFMFCALPGRSVWAMTDDQTDENSAFRQQLEEEQKVSHPSRSVYAKTDETKKETLNGIDISNWQKTIDLSKIEADFIICKASGGTSYKDPKFRDFADEILESGRLLGFYHFAREASCAGDPKEEAEHFYEVVEDYIGFGIPVLDWETDMDLGPQWVLTFLETFYELSGVKPLLYTSAHYARVYDYTDVAREGYQLWVAQWSDYGDVTGYIEDPWRDDLGLGAFEDAVMHQYTSKGKLEGYDGNLDLDIFYGTKTDWANLCKPVSERVIYPLYRLYNPNSGEHFYTKDSNERDHLVKEGWKYEGLAWNSCSFGLPVFRLYNPNAGDHHYTLDENERDTLVEAGWKYEGVGWNANSLAAAPVYRVYNPNAVTGTHHFTKSRAEAQALVKEGWKDEGLAWYSF